MTESYTPIRLIIADDHEIFREGLEGLLKKQPDIDLVAEAINGKQLIELVEKHLPDIVITDIKMPVKDGIEATKHITEKFPQVAVIALSMFDDENLIVDMLEAGAKGYLIKNASKQEIITAIKTVNQGNNYFCNYSTTRLAKMIGRSRFHFARNAGKPDLSEKEIEITRMICNEFSTKEIATHLHLSYRTIEGYREKIIEKMGVKNTAGIVVYAIKTGIYKI